MIRDHHQNLSLGPPIVLPSTYHRTMVPTKVNIVRSPKIERMIHRLLKLAKDILILLQHIENHMLLKPGNYFQELEGLAQVTMNQPRMIISQVEASRPQMILSKLLKRLHDVSQIVRIPRPLELSKTRTQPMFNANMLRFSVMASQTSLKVETSLSKVGAQPDKCKAVISKATMCTNRRDSTRIAHQKPRYRKCHTLLKKSESRIHKAFFTTLYKRSGLLPAAGTW